MLGHIRSATPRSCQQCGREFYPRAAQVRIGTGLFCSNKCRCIVFSKCNCRDLAERFWKMVAKGDGCWIWTGGRFPCGYGRLTRRGEPGASSLAHRVSWELNYGHIPSGLNVLHRCDNPPCVRPDHLFLGTQADNAADMMRKGRHPIGVDVWGAKLTPAIVRRIRKRYSQGNGTVTQISKELGCSHSLVSMIVHRKLWKWVS